MSGAVAAALLMDTTVITTVYSNAYTGSLTINTGVSYRAPTDATISAGGTQVRVTFKAGTGGTMVVANCSIGIQSAAEVTTATPVELKFSGVSGFSIASSATILSDWATLTTSNGQTLVVVIDNTSGSSIFLSGKGSGGLTYFRTGAQTYNSANPGGFSSLADIGGFNKIEVQ